MSSTSSQSSSEVRQSRGGARIPLQVANPPMVSQESGPPDIPKTSSDSEAKALAKARAKELAKERLRRFIDDPVPELPVALRSPSDRADLIKQKLADAKRCIAQFEREIPSLI